MKLRLIAEDLRRQADVSAAVFLAVALSLACVVFAALFMHGSLGAIGLGVGRLGADLAVVPRGRGGELRQVLVTGKPALFYFRRDLSSVLADIESVPGIETASPQVFVESAPASCCTEGNVFIVGIDPATDFLVAPWVLKGRRGLATQEAVVGKNVAQPLGTDIRFYGQPFRAAAGLDRTGWGYFDNGVFLTLEAAYHMAEESLARADVKDLGLTRGQASAILLKVRYAPARVRQRIEAQNPDLEVVELQTLLPQLRRTVTSVLRGLFAVAALAAVAALLLVGSSFHLLTERRAREMMLLRALGVTRRGLVGIVLGEAAFLSGSGGLAGAVLGIAVSRMFAGYITVSLAIPFAALPLASAPALAAGVTVASALVGVLAASYTAVSVSRRDRHGEGYGR